MPPKSDHDLLIEIHTAVCGIDGQNGLLRGHKQLREEFDHFRKLAVAVFFFILGSGVLGFTADKLIQFIK